jgi:hypothetical protein
MDGKQLITESGMSQQFSADVTNWESGTYIFRCEINGIPTQKIVVKCD